MTLELSSKQKLFFIRMTENQEQAKQGFDILLKRQDFAGFFDHLKASGLFSPEHNSGPVPAEDPGYVHIPYWSALDYLSAVAKQADENNDIDLAKKVMEVIRSVSGYRNSEDHKIDNHHTWRIFAEIFGLLPTNVITTQDLDLIPNWLDSRYDRGLVGRALSMGALRRFLDSHLPEDRKKAVIILDYCTTIKWAEDESLGRNRKKPVSVVDEHWLKEIIQLHASNLGAKAGKQSTRVFLKRIEEIFGKNFGDLPTYMSRPAVEDHDQNHTWEYIINAVVEGFRDILASWVDHEPENATEFVGALLTDENEMARRIGIYILNQKWPVLGKLYSTVISPEFFNPRHIHELYHLLRDRFIEFNDSQKEATFQAIQKLPRPAEHENPDRFLKYHQRNWLSAILGKGYEPADLWFRALNADPNLGPLSKHPDFHYYSEMLAGHGSSPYSAQELLAFAENKSLIERLNGFQPPGSWRGPSVEALVDTLEEAVSIHPCGFLYLLPEFLKAKRPYQYGIIYGFKSLWNSSEAKQQNLDWNRAWEKLMEFFELLIGNDMFWKEPVIQSQDLTPNRDWIPEVIAEFLHAGTRKDAKAYPPELLDRAFSLIKILLENLEPVDEPEKDAMFQAINSYRGKTIEALFSHTLRVCRISDEAKGSHTEAWDKIKPVFDAELEKCKNNNFEFSTLSAAYLDNIHYISSGWLETGFKKIFPHDYQSNFICAIDGLAYSPANKRIYKLLADHKILDNALRLEGLREQARERLIERIALACLWGDEPIDSPRFNYLFESEQIDDLRDVGRLFYNVRDQELNPEQIERILMFWEKCVKWAENLSEPPKLLLSDLSRLICYITEFTDREKNLLLAVAHYIKDGYNEDIFFKGLHRLVEQDPEKISMVLGKVLEARVPNYDYEDMLKNLIIRLAGFGRIEYALMHADRASKLPGFLQLYKQLSEGDKKTC
ncbi:MAG: hypothetical protein M0T82_07960 [Desulfobacteraceae bacterium]|nr:hypothetical protein [Desulfobacteraceae bacterium]